MRVRSAILSSLSLLPLLTTSCLSEICKAPTKPFGIDEPLSVAQLDALVAAEKTTVAEIACKRVCIDAHQRHNQWDVGKLDSCTMVLPEKAEPGKPETTGRIVCRGTSMGMACEGRRPLGHVEARDEEHEEHEDALGRSLAVMAHLEAASIVAFEELAAWLMAHDAPAALVERCRAAADDERHHARWLGSLAGERGASIPALTGRAVSDQSVLAVALHNAVEGCVHESFGALMAAVRAERAAEPRLRRAFARIAADETRHGQLAWDLDAWLRQQLDPAAERMVEQQQRDALARLPERARALHASMPAALGRLAGAQAEQLASRFAARLVG